MPRQIARFTISPVTDADGICQSQTPGGAGNLTINGALAVSGVVTLTSSQRVTITSAGNDSGRTYTITGTNRYGAVISSAITGPNATTVTGALNFKTITQVAIDGAAAGANTVGVSGVLESRWVPCDQYRPRKSVAVELSSGATLTYKVQHTLHNIQSKDFLENQAVAFDDAVMVNLTANALGAAEAPTSALRLAITAFTSGTATVTLMEG